MRRPLLALPFLLLLTSCGWNRFFEDHDLPKLPDASLLNISEDLPGVNAGVEAQILLAKGDYDGLEKAATKYESAESPSGDGKALASYFLSGVSDPSDGPGDNGYLIRMKAQKAWILARPESPFARVALARTLTNYAWFARGSDYADTVSDQGWQLFSDRLQQARDQLDAAAPHRTQCCMWYQIIATVGVGQSWKHDDFFKIINEGTTANPNFMELHDVAIMYLLPRWFGSDKELRDYITRSADNVSGEAGDVLYARLACGVWSYSHDTNVFSEVGLSWPRVKHGLTLICNRYPSSLHMASYFALFAYQSQNQPVAHYLFQHVGIQFDESVWGDNLLMQKAREWADSD